MLWYENNQITTINLKGCNALTDLDLLGNKLTALDVSNHAALTSLLCKDNQLTRLNASNCPVLENVYCEGNNLKEIYVINCPKIYYIGRDEGVKIISSNSILSSVIDALSGAIVSVYSVPSAVFSSSGKILEAVSEIDAVKNSVAEENLKYAARGMQVMGMILGGQFYRLLFPVNSPSPSENFAAPLRMSLRYDKVSDDLSDDVSSDVSPDKEAEDFRLSETLTLEVSPVEFTISKNSSTPVKFTVTSPFEVPQDVYCTIVSGDNCNYFMLPRADASGRKFEAEFPSGEIFTSIDACEAEVMCVSCLSDDGGIYEMQMSNTVKVSWTAEGDGGKAPSVTGGTLPQATVGQKYSYQLKAESTTAVTWTKSGNFPEGLTLSSKGLISGTPESAGNYTLNVIATNEYGSVSAAFTLKVTGGSGSGTKPSITTDTATISIPTGTAFSLQLEASGTTPITWSKTGTLPTGLNLSSSGLISGTPKSAQTKTFKVTAKNKYGNDTKSFTITTYVPVSITTAKLADGTTDKTYSAVLKAKGSNVAWSATGLPDGFTINAKTGKISGKTSSYGEYSVVVRAENSLTNEEKTFTLKIKGVAPTISGTLKTPELNKAYSSAFTVKGTYPIEWSISGNLPDGLSLNGNVIEGTPTVSGNKSVTIYAKNPVSEVKKKLTLKIAAVEKAETNDDTKSPKDTQTTPSDPDDEESDTPEEPEEEATESPQDDEEDTAHSEGEYVIVAELGEISRDVEGLYDFSVVLSDDAVAGAELVYIANSSEPSSDDEIAEFFDETGKETSEVPESRHITISIWLNKEVIYNPAVGIRK